MAYSEGMKPLKVGLPVSIKDEIEDLSDKYKVSQNEVVRVLLGYMLSSPIQIEEAFSIRRLVKGS